MTLSFMLCRVSQFYSYTKFHIFVGVSFGRLSLSLVSWRPVHIMQPQLLVWFKANEPIVEFCILIVSIFTQRQYNCQLLKGSFVVS
jgi:hypothetical protein